MPPYRPYDYNQFMMIPVRLEEQLDPGTLEYAIHHLIEERIDTRFFDERFCNDEEGRSAYDPKVLLKIVLYGFAPGIGVLNGAVCERDRILLSPDALFL